MNARKRIVHAAMWLVAHNKYCSYSEGPERTSCVHKPFKVPYVSDCSTGVTNLYAWGGAPDPNKLDFKGDPYTGTLVKEGRLIRASAKRSCDIVIFGPDTGWHAAMVLDKDLLWSMGEQGDPRIYPFDAVLGGVAYAFNVEEKDCPVRYFRYDTRLLKVKRVPVQTEDDFVKGTVKEALK